MREIILASKSPYRKQLLQRLGIEFSCINSGYDESILKKTIKDPVKLTQKLAIAKAKSVQELHKSSIIIGSDQVCYHDGIILGKTNDIDKSFDQLKSMQGSEHQLITSYCILVENQEILRTNTTKLKVRSLSDIQIKNYLRNDNPIDCAGSYKLELNGISLMESIETDDHTAIIGLPLIYLANDLNDIGVNIPPK